mgnify:CR=1 FL=1
MRNNIVLNEPLSRHTSWKVGGPADIFFTPNDRNDLSNFLKSNDCIITWLGNGTNILVRDAGVRGAVISTRKSLNKIELIDQSNYLVEVGVSCFQLAMYATKNNFGPAAFFSGIPGSIGGALTMNAGCFGNETWEFVKSVEVMDRNGEIHQLDPEEFSISYRSVSFPFPLWFLSCVMSFPEEGFTTIEELKSMRDSRLESQPLTENTCGSVFKNPDGNHAICAGLKDEIEVTIDGHTGYYCAGMNMNANIIVNGNVGTGVAENMMSGTCLLYTSPSPRDGLLSRMPSSA